MKLIGYTEEQQKNIVNYWGYYYGKGLRTLQDIEDFRSLVDSRLDDLLTLMVLERYTDFYKFLGSWSSSDSLCNFIYLLMANKKEAKDNNVSVDGFLDLVSEAYGRFNFEQPKEELVEITLVGYEEEWSKEENYKKQDDTPGRQ